MSPTLEQRLVSYKSKYYTKLEKQEANVLKLQNTYRGYKFRKLIKIYQSYKLDICTINSMDFNDLTDLISNHKLIKILSVILIKVFKIGDYREYKSAGKKLLCAYLFINFAEDTIGDQTIETNENISKLGVKAIYAFECWINSVGTAKFSKYLNDFNLAWFEYYFAFDMWKVRDKETLLTCMQLHYKDMVKMYHSIKLWSKIDNTDLLDEIRNKADSLKNRIIELYGSQVFDSIDIENRDVLSTDPTNDKRKESYTDIKLVELTNKTNNMYEQGGSFDKISIIHELAINHDYKFQENTNIEQAIEQISQNIQHIEESSYLDFIDNVLYKTEKICLDTAKISEIKRILDRMVLKQQIENGACNFSNYNLFILQTMGKLCAPIRDELIKKIQTIGDIEAQCRAILLLLDEMIIDIINYQIDTIKPILTIELAQSYERNNFMKKIGNDDMENTVSWFKNADNEKDLYLIFVANSLDLLFSTGSIADNCPETFELDRNRLFWYQNRIQELCVLSSLIILIKYSIKRPRYNSQVDLIKSDLENMLSRDDININIINDFVLSFISNNGFDIGLENEDLLKRMISKTINSKDPFFNILNRRLKMTLKHYIINKTMFSSDKLESYGFSCISSEIKELAKNVEHLLSYHFHVYKDYYSRLI